MGKFSDLAGVSSEREPQTIDKATAEDNLIEDAQAAENAARRVFPEFDTLDKTRQGVLVNMAFNLGPQGLSRFRTTLDAAKDGDFDAAADSMLRSRWARQVGPRAKRLAKRMRVGGEVEGDDPAHIAELEQLKRDEGFRAEPYKDTTGNTTVGYGRNLDARGEGGMLSTGPGQLLDIGGQGMLMDEGQPTLQATPQAAPTVGKFAQLSLGTPDSPTPTRPRATGFMNKAKDVIDQYVDEIWHAIPRSEEQSQYKLREVGKLLNEGVPIGTISRGQWHTMRETMGIPVSQEEERSLAAAFAIAKPELEDPKVLKKYLTETFKYGGASKAEWEATARGTWNIATAPLFMLGPTGYAARAGVTGLRTLVPNIVARQVMAVEAHAIASFVTYEVGRAAIEGEDKSNAAWFGAGVGALAPFVGYTAGKLGGAAIKGAIKGAKVAAKPSIAMTDWALRQADNYTFTRSFIDAAKYTWDRGWVLGMGRSGAGVLKKHGLYGTLGLLEKVRTEKYITGGSWALRSNDAMWKMSKGDRIIMGRLFHTPQEEWGAVAAQASNPQRTILGAAKIKQLFDEVAPLAEQYEVLVGAANGRHLRVFGRRQDFSMPHVYKNTKQFVEAGEMQEAAIKSIQLQKPGTSRSRAIKILEGIHKRNTSRMKADDYEGLGHVNLEGRKWNLPGYVDDPKEFLTDYFSRMAHEITQAKYFGDISKSMKPVTPGTITAEAMGPSGIEKLFQMPLRSNKAKYPKAFEETEKMVKGSDRKLAEYIIEHQLGAIDMGNKAVQFLSEQSQYQAVMKLGLSQFTQLTQFGAGTIPTGYRGAASGLFKLMGRNKELHELALQSGAILPSLVRESEMALAGGGRAAAMNSLKRLQFTRMDTAARVLGAERGATTAAYQAQELALLLERRWVAKGIEKKYVEGQIKKIGRKFEDLGINVDDVIANNGHLTNDQILTAAQKISTDANFWGDALSLPAFYKSAHGKFLTQFKSYSYQQGIFLKNAVLTPALERGETGPLVRMLINMEVTGEVIEDIKSWIKGKERPEGYARALENLVTGGGFSILYDAIRATNFTGGIESMIVGPILSDIFTGFEAAGKAIFYKQPNLAQQRFLAFAAPMLAAIPGPIGKMFFAMPALTPRLMNELKKKQKENR